MGSFWVGGCQQSSLIGCNGFRDPINKVRDAGVHSGPHGVGTAQTPGRHALDHKLVLGVAHQRAAAVTLQGEHVQADTATNHRLIVSLCLFGNVVYHCISLV